MNSKLYNAPNIHLRETLLQISKLTTVFSFCFLQVWPFEAHLVYEV